MNIVIVNVKKQNGFNFLEQSKKGKVMANIKIYIFIFILLFTGCVLEPEKEYIYAEREIYVGEIIGDVPLQYSYTEIYPGYSRWKDAEGMLLKIVAYNLSDSAWYGYPEIRIYTVDEPMDIGKSFTSHDLLVKDIGVLTTDIDDYYRPTNIVDFIPPHEYVHALAFAEYDYRELKLYYYVLWRFIPTNTLSKISSVSYDKTKWRIMKTKPLN